MNIIISQPQWGAGHFNEFCYKSVACSPSLLSGILSEENPPVPESLVKSHRQGDLP
jgi:hypothetical protein